MKDERIYRMAGTREIGQEDELLSIAQQLAEMLEEERGKVLISIERMPKGPAWAKFLKNWLATHGKGDC